MKQSIITAFLGKTQDRFSEYQHQTTLKERLEIVRDLEPFDGVEVVYPYETGDPKETLQWMKQCNLHWAAINANIKKEPELVPGALSRPDPAIRRKAVDIIRGAKDYAAEVGAPLVTCCPLSDGYDNLFQTDYSTAWKHLIESAGEAASYRPEIPLYLEFKYSETRVHCLLPNTDRTLLLLKELQCPGTGVTIDFGHSMYAQENPAQSIALAAESGFPFYLHTNDNDGRFDWDLIGATRHLLHYVEFLFYAREYEYDKYFTTDASPRIFDMKGFFEQQGKITRGLWNLVEGLDRKHYRKLMREENHVELMRLVNEEIYRIRDAQPG